MYKNVAGQHIGCQMTYPDGTNFTGAVTVYITGDAGTQAVGSVGAGACTHEGKGYHTYFPSQAETNYDLIAFTFEGSGAVTVTIQVETVSSTFATDVAEDVTNAVLAEIGNIPTASEIASAVTAQLSIPGILIGPGADLVTLTITDEVTSFPLVDAEVWISTTTDPDSAYSGTLRTNALGEVQFMLDAGSTYYLWMVKPGYNPIIASPFVAVADP